MFSNKTDAYINGLHRYWAETVAWVHLDDDGTVGYWLSQTELSHVLCIHNYSTFSHVLHSLTAEVVWPGDAAELFFRDMFAVRLVNEVEVYQEDNMLLAHIREELMRLCGDYYTTEELWLRDFDYSSELYNYSFEDEKQFDDDDEDTLHSELLLTEEYIAPDSVSVQTQTLRPQRRVGAFQHIEQED